MPSDLASYLASNYLSSEAPKSQSARQKKRKRKQDTGLLITDDDETGWGTGPEKSRDNQYGDIDPVTIAGANVQFRKVKASNWKSLSGERKGGDTARDSEAATAADAILASAAAERKLAQQADDEAPVVARGADGMDVEAEDNPNTQRMADGTLAGLQSAASLPAQIKRQRQRELEAWERELAISGANKEVLDYRDASGRRTDAAAQRESTRRAMTERQDKEQMALDVLKGDIQVEEARLRREQLVRAKKMTLARKADDEEMNRELKDQERWNDPMAQFLVAREDFRLETTKDKGKRRPVYTGPAPPNRYGIRPGYRWDGVDRGNGFENDRFKAINRRERNKGLEYTWQMDE